MTQAAPAAWPHRERLPQTWELCAAAPAEFDGPAAAERAIDLDDEISLVANELRIDTESTLQRAFDLCRRVVVRTERANRARDQSLQRRNLIEPGGTDVGWHRIIEAAA